MEIFLFLVAAICFILSYVGFKERKKQKIAEEQKKRLQKKEIEEKLKGKVTVDYSLPRPSYNKKKKITPEFMKYTKARKLSENYVILDFETTGFDCNTNKIIQVAAVKYKDNEKVDEYTTDVNPEEKLSSKIKSITGLADEDLINAPLIESVLPELVEFISNETLVAHNASFDMKFLLHNLNQYEFPYKRYRVIDTLSLSRKNISTPNHKLVTLKEYLNLDHLDSHNALHDCYVAAEVYKYCYEKSLVSS
ncbi:PolC-type DNA polymerase III [Virgibacillus oceani]